MNRKGLTLIEVILAVCILAGGLAVLLTSASHCLSVLKRAKVYQKARWVLGVGEVDHPQVIVDDIDDLTVDGVEYDGFTFSREVEDDDDDDDLYVVRTRVSWDEGGREMHEETVGYVLHVEEEVKQ